MDIVTDNLYFKIFFFLYIRGFDLAEKLCMATLYQLTVIISFFPPRIRCSSFFKQLFTQPNSANATFFLLNTERDTFELVKKIKIKSPEADDIFTF